jgi:hypothetical protein
MDYAAIVLMDNGIFFYLIMEMVSNNYKRR